MVEHAARNGDQGIRVDAAAHAERERNVGTQSNLDRAQQARTHGVDGFIVRDGLVRTEYQVPVPALGLPFVPEAYPGRRGKLPRSEERRVGKEWRARLARYQY